MTLSPYITRINTQILKKLLPQGKAHLALKDAINLDYNKYNCFKESFYIDGNPVESIYDSSLGPVYVVSNNPEKKYVELSVDYKNRVKILKSLTSRYLIVSALNKYLNLTASDFKTGSKNSSFSIDKIYFENQAIDLINTLEKVINTYISFGMNVEEYDSNGEAKVKILGIYSGDKLCPHLSNISELGNFEISHYTFDNNGITLYYNN